MAKQKSNKKNDNVDNNRKNNEKNKGQNKLSGKEDKTSLSGKTGSKNNNKRLIIAIVLAVVIVAAVLLANKFSNKDSAESSSGNAQSNDISQEETEYTTDPDEEYVTDDEGNIVTPGLVIPSSTSLDVSSISGYEAKTSEISIGSDTIEVKSIGMYSGQFIEDGSDENRNNIAAAIVTNKSDQMLQVGILEFQVNDDETATFQITNLPAGTSVMVMEYNGREYSDDDDYSFGTVSTGFVEQKLYSDMFEISGVDGELSLTNNTDTTYSTVYVYYKYIQIGGSYLGGITYRTPFEDVEPGETVTSVAGHYRKNTSVITMVSYEE